MNRLRIAIGCLLMVGLAQPARASDDAAYDRWLAQYKERAVETGIPSSVVEEAFADVVPDDEVVALDQKQPEDKISFTQYLANTVTKRRVKQGRALMEEYREPLARISKKYQVPPQYIVALWGIESDYGNNKGSFSVVQSLATLAYEGRRAEFFGNELMSALQILNEERPSGMILAGSWAGAMGDCQFMPSTYVKFAADGDGDGKRDIWDSPPDVFASVANYLHSLGWKYSKSWGRAVSVPKHIPMGELNHRHPRSMHEWTELGIKNRNGTALPRSAAMLYLYFPGTRAEGAYLVSENYLALLQWNRSRYFATSVGILADKIGEK